MSDKCGFRGYAWLGFSSRQEFIAIGTEELSIKIQECLDKGAIEFHFTVENWGGNHSNSINRREDQ